MHISRHLRLHMYQLGASPVQWCNWARCHHAGMTTKPLSVSDRSLALWLVHKQRYKVLVGTHPAHRVITRSQRTPLAWGPGIQDHLPISKWILHVRLCSNLAQYLETKSQLPNFFCQSTMTKSWAGFKASSPQHTVVLMR